MKTKFLLLLASTLCVFVLIEGGLRLVGHLLPPASPSLRALASALAHHNEAFWMERFVQASNRGSGTLGENEPHRELGWAPRKNQRLVIEGKTISTNDIGARGQSPYVRDPRKFLVLTVGDSFTFGAEANDDETWPALLENVEPRIQVVNMGVCAYGTDQIALRLEQVLAQLKPDLVVVAFIEDDLKRSLLSFRDYKKPRFRIQGKGLTLTNTPIGGPDEVLREAKITLEALSRTKLSILMGNFVRHVADKFEQDELNTRIFERMIQACVAQQVEFLLLYLPYRNELTDPAATTDAEKFFKRFTDTHKVLAVDPRPLFLARRANYATGHYQKVEATIVAQAVRDCILESITFAAKIKN